MKRVVSFYVVFHLGVGSVAGINAPEHLMFGVSAVGDRLQWALALLKNVPITIQTNNITEKAWI